ncbi:sel1 repeat family protein [Hansschlegelia sp.]|uniref:sel1 repeat family protein n=1 Tax=Hansschlegelia sp. TaxID=2041892 RepID=UPI002B65A073|nr:sel1 repeat family protein [Hansschlegelia sp.]HVI28930.1 sel1 repeat family protein [Hansschlegelia sp.]
MARYDMSNIIECGALGAVASGAVFFQLGMTCAVGRYGAIDRVAAHKWFNLAARDGVAEAVRMRRELALEMSAAEIAEAQRAAREWLAAH